MPLPVSGGYARYQAKDYDPTTNTWLDSTGNGHTIPSSQIASTGLKLVTQDSSSNGVTNSFIALQGSTKSKVQLTLTRLSPYTLFHVARYTGGSQMRIFEGSGGSDWFSGFYWGSTAIAYHDRWVTNSTGTYTTDWILSTDAAYSYRANGVSQVTHSTAGDTYLPPLWINGGIMRAWEVSTFAVADVIIFNTVLTATQIAKTESYLADLYNISTARANIQAVGELGVQGLYLSLY